MLVQSFNMVNALLGIELKYLQTFSLIKISFKKAINQKVRNTASNFC